MNNENENNKMVCDCGNNSFYVYIKTIIDDARLYCTSCS